MSAVRQPPTMFHLAGGHALPGPLVMLLLCFCGMATGLAIDVESMAPAT